MKRYSILTAIFFQDIPAVKFSALAKKYTSSLLSNALPIISICLGLCLTIHEPLRAQEVEVPRTRTYPGIEKPAFPYAQAEEVGLSGEKLNRLGDEIESWVAHGELVGGELLIIKDGKAVFHEAYGWSDRERRIPVMRNSIWSIKSMSKPFTATAILMLAEEGKLSLDDPVNRYIQGFAGDERTTIRHLLSHTSGYSNKDLGDPRPYHDSLAEWIEEWASIESSGTFGEYEYTDFGFGAAGYIVEAITGLSIGRFTEERIADPLGLEDSRAFFSENPAWRARLNPWYRWNKQTGWYELRWTKNISGWRFYPAAWGMFSTAMDYAGFMKMWMNGGHYEGVRLLSEETVEEALDPHALIDENFHWQKPPLQFYGYGWFIEQAPGEEGMPRSFFHGGGDGTLAMGFPGKNSMVIFLTHSRGGRHLRALENRLSLLGILDYPGLGMVWGEDAGLNPVELSPDERESYVGTYRGRALTGAGEQEIVGRVWKEADILHYQLGAIGERTAIHHHLVPLGNDTFAPGRYDGKHHVAADPHLRVRFVVEGSQAKTLEVQAGGNIHLTAQRANSDQLRVDTNRILAEREALRNQTPINMIVLAALEAGGTEAAKILHRDLLASRPDSVRFGEPLLGVPLLGMLGGWLLREGRTREATAVFEMNVEAYPEISRARGALADVYLASGRLEDARRHYERAVELAEQQGHENLEAYRGKLKQVTQQLQGKQVEE